MSAARAGSIRGPIEVAWCKERIMPAKKNGRGLAGKTRVKKRKPQIGKDRLGKGKPRAAYRENPNANRAMLVINPVAGTGRALDIWEDLQETLHELGMDFDYQFTEYKRHAVEIAREAADKRYKAVVAVGGDGTVYEVTNGLMAVARESRPRMGVIPCGRSSDFCRTVDIPQDWLTAASLLASGRHRTIDIGWMEYRTAEGVSTGYFANVAGLGFDGEVTERADSMPKKLTGTVGGVATYAVSLLITAAGYREKDVELQVDDREYRVLATTVVIANCQYFSGRMCIAPEAEPDDELFDVIVIGAGFGSPVLEGPRDEPPPAHSIVKKGIAKVKMLRNVPRLYRGTHLQDESIMVTRGKKVKVVSDDRMVLQADGEVIGEGPFITELMPGALDVIA